MQESINLCEEDSSSRASPNVTTAFLLTAIVTGGVATFMTYKSAQKDHDEKRKSEIYAVVKDFLSQINEIKKEIDQKHNLVVMLMKKFPDISVNIINRFFSILEEKKDVVLYKNICESLIFCRKEDKHTLLKTLIFNDMSSNESEENNFLNLTLDWMSSDYDDEHNNVNSMVKLLTNPNKFYIYHFFHLALTDKEMLLKIIQALDECFGDLSTEEIKEISNTLKECDKETFSIIKNKLTDDVDKAVLDILLNACGNIMLYNYCQ